MNALQEFIEHVNDKPLLCATISLPTIMSNDGEILNGVFLNLPIGFNKEQLNAFLNAMSSIEYDDGYGSQELFGIIWYHDGTWSERHEYDGSEEWRYKCCPTVPEYLRRKIF